VRSALFCKDASNLTAWLMQTSELTFHSLPPAYRPYRLGTPSPACLSTCSIFLTHLTQHIAHLTGLIDSESKGVIVNKGRLLFLRFGCVIRLTNLAQISFLLAKISLSAAESAINSRGICKDALKRAVTMMEQLEPEEFFVLDMFMTASIIYTFLS
jgi:hypothetical protein